MATLRSSARARLLLGATLMVGCSANPSMDASMPDSGNAETGSSPEDVRDTGPDVTPARCSIRPAPMAFRRNLPSIQPTDATLRMNHLQAKATHNSYHLRPAVDLPEWDYEHAPLRTQLMEQGVRSVELDIHYDSACRQFAVYHVASLDERTTCRTLFECLLALRDFSQANPGHHPIFVHIEPKDPPLLMDGTRFTALEGEITAVFSRDWIITPDEVRGASATLREAISTRGWPSLETTRGRILFYLDDRAAPRETYSSGGQHLNGRLMFVDSAPTDPVAAIAVLNDPIADAEAITRALAAGMIVRTRADSDPAMARSNGAPRLARALASGAQLVSTDFPAMTMGTDYVANIPEGTPSRCSPVTAPAMCTPGMIEDPARLAR
ncbi:MAG: Ca2+-dependent phosphoinositide-specific phospholipase C [Deltaproteobacteria bacterium]|nr:Ca2+-dependent phosphoinositide-specific phospholipase C [Deltaproteobacteria bacterium]